MGNGYFGNTLLTSFTLAIFCQPLALLYLVGVVMKLRSLMDIGEGLHCVSSSIKASPFMSFQQCHHCRLWASSSVTTAAQTRTKVVDPTAESRRTMETAATAKPTTAKTTAWPDCTADSQEDDKDRSTRRQRYEKFEKGSGQERSRQWAICTTRECATEWEAARNSSHHHSAATTKKPAAGTTEKPTCRF